MSTVTLASLENLRSELVKSRFYLNIRAGYMPPVTLHCTYGDTTNSVTFYIFDRAEKLDLTGYTVTLSGTRSDGNSFGPIACTVNKHAFTFQLTNAITGAYGSAIAEVTVKNGNTTVGSSNFGIIVEDVEYPNGVFYDTDPSIYKDILSYLSKTKHVDGAIFKLSDDYNIIHYGESSTAAATRDKLVTCQGFVKDVGSIIYVRLVYANTAVSPCLNVNNTGAAYIRYRNANVSSTYLVANEVYCFVYDGTYYQLVGDVNTEASSTAIQSAVDTWLNQHTSSSTIVYSSDVKYTVVKSTSDIAW